MRKLRALVESIGFRLLVPLCIAVGIVLAIHAVFSFRSTQEHFLRFVRADARRSGELIERATHDGMLLNRLAEVQATFERLADGSDIAAVRCYSKQGTIVLSADRSEIGQRIALDSETCRSCHGREGTKPAAVLERSRLARTAEGPSVLRHLAVIPNEAGCSTADCHAHPPDRKVLGVLDVEMSMAPLETAIRAAQGQLAWTTATLLLIIAVVAGLFVRRLVHRPVLQLRIGTERIARGDLDTRIDMPGEHVLAQLARSFNAMVNDLRDARRSEAEWSQTLEEKVARKTEELQSAQRQVLHMEKMASLGKLSASVAHELNNPLAGMLTYARLIKREVREQPLSPDVRDEFERYLSVVEQECRRCGEIVKNMLVFARRSGTRMAAVNFNEIVERGLMLVRHHLEMSNIELQADLLPEGAEIVADGDQIQQALLALLVNAVEAIAQARSGDGKLTVRLRATAEEVGIEVGDNGVGIPPQVLPHIFEPFFSTKQKESGVGLGLAVAYGIVHRHGGRIEVESEPGRGTTFRLSLPRRPTAAGEAPAVAESGAT